MLTSIRIQNFLSCADVTLTDLRSVVALVGRNGAGKTNILKAIYWMAQTAMSSSFQHSRMKDYELKRPSFEIEVKLHDVQFQYQLTIDNREPHNKSTNGTISPSVRRLHVRFVESLKIKENDQDWQVIFSRADDSLTIEGEPAQKITIPDSTTSIPAILSLFPPESQIVAKIKPFAAFLNTIRYYPVDEPSEPNDPVDASSLLHNFEYEQAITDFESGLKSVCLRIIHMYLTSQARFDELVELLGEKGLRLIDDIIVNRYNLDDYDFYFIKFKLGEFLGGGDRTFRYAELSLGTRRILQILTSLIFDDSAVMLIEHPEDGIHSGLLGRLISLLDTNSDPAQLILSSHSAVLLNRLRPECIRLVRSSDHRTSVQSLSAAEIEVAKRYIGEEGTLFEYLSTLEDED